MGNEQSQQGSEHKGMEQESQREEVSTPTPGMQQPAGQEATSPITPGEDEGVEDAATRRASVAISPDFSQSILSPPDADDVQVSPRVVQFHLPAPVRSIEVSSDIMSVASASTLETYFADAHSEEGNVLKEDLKQLEQDYQLQGSRLKGVESTVRQLRKKMREVEREKGLLETRRDDEVAEIESLRRQFSTVLGLDASLKAAIGEIDRLKKVKSKEAVSSDRDTELESCQMKVQALSLELSVLNDQMLSERAENKRIQEDLESQLQEMLDKVLGMEATAKESTQDAESIEVLQQEVAVSRNELEKLKEDLIERGARATPGGTTLEGGDANFEVLKLQLDLAEKESFAEALKDQVSSCRSQIERLKKAMAQEKLLRDEDEQQLCAARVEIDKLQQSVDSKKKFCIQVEGQLVETRDECRKLEDSLSREISAHEVDEQDLVDARSEIGRLKESIEEEKAAYKDYTAVKEREQYLQGEVVQTQYELNQVRESLEATRAENVKLVEEAKAEFERLENEISNSISERERLRVSLSPQMQVSEAVSAAVKPRDQEIKDLRKQVSLLNQATKKADDEKNWLQARLKVFKEESALLENQKFSMQRELEQELRFAKTDGSNAKAESQRLHQRLESLNKEVEVAHEEIEALQHKLAKFRHEHAKATVITLQAEDKILQLKNELKSRDADNEKLRNELKQAAETITAQNQLLFGTKGENGIGQIDSRSVGNTENVSREPPPDGVGDDRNNDVSRSHENAASVMQSDDVWLETSEGERDDSLQETFSTPQSMKNGPEVRPDREVLSIPSLNLLSSTVSVDSEDTPRKTGRANTLDSFEEHVHKWPRSWHDNDTHQKYGGRDVTGYGLNPPKPMWPNMAKVALNFTIHFDEGAEMCLLHDDSASEYRLTEMDGATPLPGERNLSVESIYEYGSRAGFWRLHRLFNTKGITPTVFAAGMALERNIQVCHAMKESGWEVSSHGYRQVDYRHVDTKTQIEDIKRTIAIHQKILGDAPVGVHLGSPSPESRKIASQKFYYDSDSYSDELPFWSLENGSPHLVIPYTMTENDMRFVTANGFSNGQDFCRYLTQTLDTFIAEGREGRPRMMSVALHCRIVGRPGRAQGLAQFIDYAKGLGSEVWICTREDIARYWYDTYYPMGQGKPVATVQGH